MRTVYFFTSPHCGACEAFKPAIEDFTAKHGGEVIVLRCNPMLKEYEFGRWRVKYTPTVVVTERGHLVGKVEGRGMTVRELEQFVFKGEA